MWKKILAKVLGNVFVKKLEVWFKETGFTNVIYLTLAVGTLLGGGIPLGMVGLTFLKSYLVGAFIGIFCYLNWNIIVKLYKAKIGDKIEDIIDNISDKL